ncbi:MAG TPA: aminoglycoside phosphotransferase family protein [Kofleriaceae bacterium]|nr:aminoglycoside phosphotransferase family protein [Kofleriaceae bacterium]
METPEPVSDFAACVAELCPGFVADGSARVARKSELIAGRIGERAVIAKRLKKPNAVWAWYLEHEIAIYRAFAAHGPGVRAPRFVAATSDILVVEHFRGEALSDRRRPNAALPIRTIAALIAAHDQLARYVPKLPLPAPSPRVRAQLRERLLEDPGDPSWIRDGARLCGRRGRPDSIDDELAKRIDHALAAYPATAFSHGDLLLRNVIADPDDEEDLGIVDWECAGIHPRDWDLALLWSQLAGPARTIVEDAVRDSGIRWRAFLGMVIFAFARELRFLEAFQHTDVAHAEIAAELASAAQRFLAA